MALFSSGFFVLGTVAFSFLFDNYCLIKLYYRFNLIIYIIYDKYKYIIYIIKRFDFLKDETYIYLWSNGVKVAYMALFSSGFFLVL